jgi:hypothetical protein
MELRENAPPQLSRHAHARAQARGIPLHIINTILAHTDRRHSRGRNRGSPVRKKHSGSCRICDVQAIAH